MASLDEDIEAQTTVIHQPWLRLAQLPERLAAAGFAPEAFRKELQEANAELLKKHRPPAKPSATDSPPSPPEPPPSAAP